MSGKAGFDTPELCKVAAYALGFRGLPEGFRTPRRGETPSNEFLSQKPSTLNPKTLKP